MYIYLNICIYCIMSYMYVQSKQRMHLAKTRLESHRETARNNKEKEREAGEALRGKAQAEKLSQKLECQATPVTLFYGVLESPAVLSWTRDGPEYV